MAILVGTSSHAKRFDKDGAVEEKPQAKGELEEGLRALKKLVGAGDADGRRPLLAGALPLALHVILVG